MNKSVFITSILLTTGVILSGCGQSDVEKEVQPQQNEVQPVQKGQQPTPEKQTPSKQVPSNKQEKNKEGKTHEQKGEAKKEKTSEQLMREKIDEQDKKIKELTEEVEYYRVFVKNFTATFTTDKMNEFIEKEWNYDLGINNIKFPKDGVMELTEHTFDLVLKEDKVKYSVIPDEMSEKGRIPNGISGQLSVEGDIQYDEKDDIGDKHSVITYSFKDVPSGTVIKLQISDELQKKLKMDKKDLEIRIQ